MLAELAEQHVEQRPDLVGVLDVGGLGGVEHGQQGLGEASRGAVDVGGVLRARRAVR